MRQPPGFPLADESKVLRLCKTIYGLKQSGRRWYERLHVILRDIGLKRCEIDHAVFFRIEKHQITIIAAHVDDLTLIASTLHLMLNLKAKLSSVLEMTDLGELHWLLEIEIKRDRDSRTIYLFSFPTILHPLDYQSPWSRGRQAVVIADGSQHAPEKISIIANTPKCAMYPIERQSDPRCGPNSALVLTFPMPSESSRVSLTTLAECFGKL
jgi:hypothetical protein